MKEQIGKITLDYTYYMGEDLYCDGAVEDELLRIVQENDKKEFGRIIEESGSWPILYHLSPLRGNIAEWFPVKTEAKLLEIGSGCGAITGTLAKKAKKLDCIDLSRKRSLINAYRNKDCDGVSVIVGNFKDIEPHLDSNYDYIFLIGVLEYGQLYMDSDTPYEDFVRTMKKHLAPDGKIVIAIENKYGLKYWAGCREDHLGTFFSGIENYPGQEGIKTFTRTGLEKIIKAAGCTNYHFYYPYPDYKFMTTLYSDAYLPKKGELSLNNRNFDRSRLALFDEKEAFDGIIEEGLFPLYSNSYLVVIGDRPQTNYVKYSNDRKEEFCIRTEIRQEAENLSVHKYALSLQAKPHIEQIRRAYVALQERYRDSGMEINVCSMEKNGIQFPYLQGKTLEILLDDCLDRGEEAQFEAYVDRYLQFLAYHAEQPVADVDFIFSNILIENGKWQLIDYEWTVFESRDPKTIAFRAFYCYLIGAQRRRDISFKMLEKKLQITQDELGRWLDQEYAFQNEITGNRKSMMEIRDAIGNAVYPVEKLIAQLEQKKDDSDIQVYEDCGEGFSEENSFMVPEREIVYTSDDKEEMTVHVPVKKGVRAVRIDPAFSACLILFEETVLDEKRYLGLPEDAKTNGFVMGDRLYGFSTADPGFVIATEHVSDITVKMKRILLPADIAGKLPQGEKKRSIWRIFS